MIKLDVLKPGHFFVVVVWRPSISLLLGRHVNIAAAAASSSSYFFPVFHLFPEDYPNGQR